MGITEHGAANVHACISAAWICWTERMNTCCQLGWYFKAWKMTQTVKHVYLCSGDCLGKGLYCLRRNRLIMLATNTQGWHLNGLSKHGQICIADSSTGRDIPGI